ncbi:MAG: hypothetical protein GEU99_13265 [Luteitalea sp.]|nr:hypothetical protein [Luteitalea sp.]
MQCPRVAPIIGLVFMLVIGRGFAAAQGQSAEVPEPVRDGVYPNIFYGAELPTATTAPVLVFVHGFGGNAQYWWGDNNMYRLAYLAGYRTAFIGLSADNTPNHESLEVNAVVLQQRLPRILHHYQVEKAYLIGHSKGGVDIQAAMLDPATAAVVRAVFTISSPNQGTELADWAFEHPQLAAEFNLLTPAVNSLRTANMAGFRELADPVLRSLGVPFYTTTGNRFVTNVVTLVTGSLLRDLVPGAELAAANDGFVTVARSQLSPEFATDLGVMPTHHFDTDTGSAVFTKIRARIQGLETTLQIFDRVATNGVSEFGGVDNSTWAWSAKWFKGKLYVGTASEALCMSLLTADVRVGTNVYPSAVNTGQCPDFPKLVKSLGAEIWQYTPERDEWIRVFKSRDTIPLFDEEGNIATGTARDVGFRGMEVFVEPDGTEALYAGGVTSGSVFEPMPFKPDAYPPPRLLRSVDGVTWAPVPQDPGTFLGEIGNVLVDPQTKFRSFRSLVSYNGQLFATIGDYVGVGVILASANPAAGNNAWRQVSPPREEFPVWNLIAYNGFLYCTTGMGDAMGTLATVSTADEDDGPEGYGVYKTDARGRPPYKFVPVVINGGYQPDRTFRSPNGLSFAEFKGDLYLGTNRPTELIRIRPDDSWDLVVGEPRNTPDGFKAPISGFGNGFGSWFNGHFWRMASDGDHLYLGTWDWSIGLQYLFPSLGLLDPIDKLFSHQYGFDLFRTSDGVHWTAVTQSGMGDPNNSGVRSLEATPIGLFIGTARQRNGFQIFKTAAEASPASPSPPADVEADNQPGVVRLSWTPSPDAVQYRVYRAPVLPIDQLLARTTLTMPTPDGKQIKTTVPGILAGELDAFCAEHEQESVCVAIDAVKQLGVEMSLSPASAEGDPLPNAYPLPYELAAITTDTTFSEVAPSWLQSLYVVRAEDAYGVLSEPSNFVGAPSKAR